ncbi:MAG: hypothetical protein V4475_14685 [Pseudomonadota bacterium]
MRVVSSLADIDFGVGRIGRSGRNLVIESSADSTIATKVTVSPRDALRSLGALVASPSAWWFVLSLPVAAFRGRKPETGDAWVQRRASTGLNKPW